MIKAQGQLRHRFWGTYSARIVLQFSSAEDAAACLPLLGEGWEQRTGSVVFLEWQGNSEQLDACTATLVSFGADGKKIASIAKSVDYGEPFECSFSLVAVSKNQLPLEFLKLKS